jgi:hypothetical protein
MNYIEKGTEYWALFLNELELSRKKSNKDLFCTKCWRVLNYQEARNHKQNHPDHKDDILTSR